MMVELDLPLVMRDMVKALNNRKTASHLSARLSEPKTQDISDHKQGHVENKKMAFRLENPPTRPHRSAARRECT